MDALTALPFPLDTSVPPFDSLNPGDVSKLASSLDVAYLNEGVAVFDRGETPDCLHIIVKGVVQERRDGEVVRVFAPGDCFDPDSVLGDTTVGSFIVQEEALTYQVPIAVVRDLMQRNSRFAAFFTDSLADRLRQQAGVESARAAAPLLGTPVRAAVLDPPVFIAADMSLAAAAKLMRSRRVHELLVGTPADAAVVTRTDLGDAALIDGLPACALIGPLAHRPMIEIDADAPISDAMLLVTRHGVRRLVVRDKGGIIGTLSLTALLGVLSNDTHMLSVRLRRAETIAALVGEAERIELMVRTQFQAGAKVRVIAGLVAELDAILLERLVTLLAPSGLMELCCIGVMGSEGRREKTLRTDQDQLMVLANDADPDEAAELALSFGDALADIGVPPCPGGMMVTNPVWRRSLGAFQAAIDGWIHRPDETAPLYVAAMVDARPVAGRADLLEQVRAHLFARAHGEDAFLARFAHAVNAFPTPRFIGPLALLDLTDHARGVDVKKAGLFPIVHGARSLALALGLTPTGTVDRLHALADQGTLSQGRAADLVEAFQFLQTLQLDARLAASRSPTADLAEVKGGLVDLRELPRTRLALLKDALHIVADFKSLVSHHFRLSML